MSRKKQGLIAVAIVSLVLLIGCGGGFDGNSENADSVVKPLFGSDSAYVKNK